VKTNLSLYTNTTILTDLWICDYISLQKNLMNFFLDDFKDRFKLESESQEEIS